MQQTPAVHPKPDQTGSPEVSLSPDFSSSATTTTPTSVSNTNVTGASGISTSSSSASIASAAGGLTTGSHGSWPNTVEDNYELREVIGFGATAVVNAAWCKPRNEMCAIKRINLEKWNPSMDELHKEILAMSSCNHENIVTYFTSFVHKEELWLVLRLLEYGSLLDIIRHRTRSQDCSHGVFEECTIATVLREVLRGLEYLHNSGHIHRDIKAGNILLGADGQVQIADFGVSAYLASGGDLSRIKSRHTFVGTPCWMAPEVMEQVTGYGFKADIWSFGITAIELVTGTAPYHKYSPMKVLVLTLKNEPPNLDTELEDKDAYKHYGKSLRKMICECLQRDPAKRPTATDLLKHPFFKNKAKDRKWIQANVVNMTPSLTSRSYKSRPPTANAAPSNIEPKSANNKVPGASGRLHRDTSGTWVWSSDDEDDEPTSNNGVQHPSSPSINLVLRIRNPKGELTDIRFEYSASRDTAQGIANELLSTGLILAADVTVLTDSIELMVSYPPRSKVCVFAIQTGKDKDEIADEKSMLGFAQLSLVD